MNCESTKEEEVYNLKLHYHESIELENKLCNRLVADKFEPISRINFVQNCIELQKNKNDENQVYPLLDSSFFDFIKQKVKSI